MKISILELTGHPLPLLEGLPRTARQIRNWLAPHMPGAEFSVANVVDGEDLPGMGTFDGVIVGGSEFGVYDDTPWMQPLRKFLLQTRKAGKPIFGICFGHQIMADTFGGKAGKAAAGNVIGARHFDCGSEVLPAYVWHQDQVTHVPEAATVTGTAAHCPVGALSYDFPASSVQFHPEYTADHLREILARGREIFVTAAEADLALASIQDVVVPRDLAVNEATKLFQSASAKRENAAS